MTLNEFKRLSQSEQVRQLYKDGVFVGKQKGAAENTIIYQLHSFYVEVRYVRYRYFVQSIIAHDDVSKIEAFLPPIDIDQLMRVPNS